MPFLKADSKKSFDVISKELVPLVSANRYVLEKHISPGYVISGDIDSSG